MDACVWLVDTLAPGFSVLFMTETWTKLTGGVGVEERAGRCEVSRAWGCGTHKGFMLAVSNPWADVPCQSFNLLEGALARGPQHCIQDGSWGPLALA